ncbi:hypothetical protein KI387_019548, partial [Taxus chinensis]
MSACYCLLCVPARRSADSTHQGAEWKRVTSRIFQRREPWNPADWEMGSTRVDDLTLSDSGESGTAETGPRRAEKGLLTKWLEGYLQLRCRATEAW